MDMVLDVFFLFFHTAIILFNIFGWIWKKTRKANLVTLLLTGSSWFLLGIFYGIGYCPVTDWHWEVLKRLGDTNLPNSYIKYLFDRITGLNIDATIVEILTVAGFFAALIISLYLNLVKPYSKRRVVSSK